MADDIKTPAVTDARWNARNLGPLRRVDPHQTRLETSTVVEAERRAPVYGEFDVVVVGGGPSGITAALAAARNGARTLLIEKYGFLGGGLNNGATGIHTFFNRFKHEPRVKPKTQLVRGLGQELVDRMTAAGGGMGHIEMIKGYDFVSMLTPIDPEMLKVVALDWMAEAGVEVMLHTTFADSIVADGAIRGIIVESKIGREAILAKRVIDCSGDADVAVRAGVPYYHFKGDNNYAVGLTFRVGNVDMERAAEFLESKGGLAQYAVGVKPGDTKESCVRIGADFTKWDSGYKDYGVRGRTLSTSLHPHDLTYINAVGYFPADAADPRSMTNAEHVLRKQAYDLVRFMHDRVGGFKDCYLNSTSVQIGVRRTRVVECLYDMKRADVLEGNTHPLEIGRYGFIDGTVYFVKDNGSYSVPYPALVPRGVDNLLTAGRTFSTDRIVHDCTRICACCFVSGQAAGTAAALSLKENVSPANVDVAALQSTLKRQGAYLEV